MTIRTATLADLPALAAVEAALSPRTALVLLNSPNNPSGVVLERSGLEALAALLRRK